MGFLGAKWIYNNEYTPNENRCVYFYKDFKAVGEVKSAYLYAASTDSFAITFNSKRINGYFDNHGIAFVKQIPIYKYDIKDLISEDNSVCVILASVRRKNHASDFLFYSVIEIEYADGKQEKIFSDESWETSFGAVFAASFHDGEKHGLSDDKRHSAYVSNDKKGYTYLLKATENPNLVSESFISPTPLSGGKTKIYDNGFSVLGTVIAKFRGKAGDKVKIRYSETKEFSDRCSDELVLSGAEDSFSNVFVYRNFRYAEIITNAEVVSFGTCKLSYNINENGDFHCSNSKINEAYCDNVKLCKDKLNDFKALISDENNIDFDLFSFDFKTYCEAALSHCRSVQAENGGIPIMSGRGNAYRYGLYKNATLLPIELVFKHFVMYGDIGIIEDNISMCKRIIDFVDNFYDGDDLEFIIKIVYSVKLTEKLCSFIGSPDEAYYKKLYQTLCAHSIDTLDFDEVSADALSMLFKYRIKSAFQLKEAAAKHSYKEVSREHIDGWLGLLYESGRLDEPYKIITSDDFDKSLCKEWLFSGCLGIRPDETAEGAGFRKVLIQPAIDTGYSIKKASGGYVTPYGKISVFWEKTEDAYTCCLTVPYEIDATCRFNGFKVVNQKSSKETYVFVLKRV